MLVEVSATLQLLDVFPLWDSTVESDDGRNKTPVDRDETILESPELQSLQFEAGELVLVGKKSIGNAIDSTSKLAAGSGDVEGS